LSGIPEKGAHVLSLKKLLDPSQTPRIRDRGDSGCTFVVRARSRPAFVVPSRGSRSSAAG
jgi:hypothetical protein